jgi:hypothetical protein
VAINPIDNPTTLNLIAGDMRGILNPANRSLRDAQRRAFDLLTHTLEPLRVAWADQAQAANALTIAEGVVQEVYHARGAFKAEEHPAQNWATRRFSRALRFRCWTVSGR